MSMITVPDTTGVNIRRSKRKTGGKQELNQGGHQDKARHGGWAGFHQCCYAHGNEGPGRAHYQDVPRSLSRPTRTACITVVMPLTSSAAKTPQEM